MVSLLAPPEDVRAEIREQLGWHVSEELLATWLEDPLNAPGRLTSSPWSDRIEIGGVERLGDGAYLVSGEIVLLTAVQVADPAEPPAATMPLRALVERSSGRSPDVWLITTLEIGEPTAAADPERSGQRTRAPRQFGSRVDLVGEIVCLPKRGDGPFTMECAFGLRDAEGEHLALKGVPESALRQGLLETGRRVRVTGRLVRPDPDTTYDIVGTIEVDEIVRSDDGAPEPPSDDGCAWRDLSSWQRFEGERFSLRHPVTFELFDPGEADSAAGNRSVPACAPGFAACVRYAGRLLSDTNLLSAGLGVFVRESSTRGACENTLGNFPVIDDVRGKSIGTLEYLVFDTGEGGMNKVANDTVHCAWRKGICCELVARIAYADPEVYEPGAVERLSEAQRDELEVTVRNIVEPFSISD
jgi:hypothetical protein